MLETALSFLFYPGLLLTVLLAFLFGWLLDRRLPSFPLRASLTSVDALASLISIVLAVFALALMPWPFHPAAGRGWIAEPLPLWIALEGAFLVPLLPGLLAPSPLAVRATSREAQIGTAGRFVLWLSVGALLWIGLTWHANDWLARLLFGLAAVMALPAALSVGMFGPERSLNAAGAEEGLDEAIADLVRFARTVRQAVVLALVAVALIANSADSTPAQPVLALIVVGALFVAFSIGLRFAAQRLPRVTLPDALRWCCWRALPVAVAALIYTIIV